MYFFSILIVEPDQVPSGGHLPLLVTLIDGWTRDSDLIGQDDQRRSLLLLHDAEQSDTFRIGERLRHQVEQQKFTLGDKWGRLTVSIGGACFPTHATDPQELLMTADHMLHKAKSLGGNQVCLPEA
jgi:diguanylate cyclase (GGDEF)-like protein